LLEDTQISVIHPTAEVTRQHTDDAPRHLTTIIQQFVEGFLSQPEQMRIL